MVGWPQKNTIRQEVGGAVQFLGHFSQPAGYCSSQSADKWLSLLIRITRAAAWRKRAARFFGEKMLSDRRTSRWKSNVLLELIPLETCRASPYHHKRDDGWWFRPSFNWILQTQFIVSRCPQIEFFYSPRIRCKYTGSIQSGGCHWTASLRAVTWPAALCH